MPSYFSLLAAVAIIVAVSTSLSQSSGGFELNSDGSKAVFEFFESNWDVVFGSISFRSFFGDFADYKNRTEHVIAALEVWHR
jgi:hypothetical protein